VRGEFGATEQADEADEALGGTLAGTEVPPRARAGRNGRGHRFAAYPRCSTDSGGLRETERQALPGSMSRLLLVAAGLTSVLAVAHSYLGERYILIPLLKRTDLPKVFGGEVLTRRTLRFAWHLTTIAWLGFAGLLVGLSDPAIGVAKSQALVIASTFAVSGLVSLVASRGRHLSWVVFFLLAGLIWVAFSDYYVCSKRQEVRAVPECAASGRTRG
jgi:hypothetical protein